MHCLDCGYSLHELTKHRCPECGRVFDLMDRRSWGTAQAFRFKTPAKIAGWIALFIPVLLGIYITVQMAWGQDDWTIVVFAWMLAGIPMAIAAAIWLSGLAMTKTDASKRATVIGFLLTVFHLGLLSEWPIHAAFAIHRDALNRQAQRVNTGKSVSGWYWKDIYRIYSARTAQTSNGATAVILQIGQGAGPDYLVYGMTDQQIESSFNIWSYRRLDPDWHIVHED